MLGPQFSRVPLAVANYRGDVADFVKIAQRGEICLHTDNKSYQAITSSGDESGGVSATTAANPSQVTTDAAHNLATGDYVMITGTGDANLDALHQITFVDATNFTVPVLGTVTSTGNWYKAASVTVLSAGTKATI